MIRDLDMGQTNSELGQTNSKLVPFKISIIYLYFDKTQMC